MIVTLRSAAETDLKMWCRLCAYRDHGIESISPSYTAACPASSVDLEVAATDIIDAWLDDYAICWGCKDGALV